MTKRLFALLLTLVMVLQPVLPAAAEAVGEDIEVTEATEVTEETVEVTEGVTEEPTEEVTEEATEEPTEEATEEVTEEVTEEATEEVTSTSIKDTTYVVVRLICDVDGVAVHVYPAATDAEPEPEEILSQKDGSYRLVPGEYQYTVSPSNGNPGEKQLFVVTDEAEQTVQVVVPQEVIGDQAAFDAAVAQGNCGDHLTWALSSDGVVTISGYGDMWNYRLSYNSSSNIYKTNAPWMSASSSVAIWKVEFVGNVTSIGDYAFYRLKTLGYKTLYFPETLRKIGKGAFAECNRYSRVIELPEGLETIDDCAFQNCSKWSFNQLPTTLKKIGSNAFEGCGNLYFNFDKSARVQVGEEAFKNAYIGETPLSLVGFSEVSSGMFQGTNIYGVNLPSYITKIGSKAFKNCTNLGYVHIQGNVTEIPTECFSGCGKLYDISGLEKITYIGASALKGTNFYSFIIPSNVKTIANYAFQSCKKLEELTIPVSVTSIGASAFDNCSSLEKVQYLGTQAQWDAISIGSGNDTLLEKLVVKPDASGNLKNGLSWALYNNGKLEISGNGAMQDFSSASAAPWSKAKVQTVVLENGVTSIGKHAFSNCVNLTSITIPEGITEIGAEAFRGCTNLDSIQLPASLKTVQQNAFSGCTALDTVYYSGKLNQWGQLTVAAGNQALTNANLLYEGHYAVSGTYCTGVAWKLDANGTLTISGTGKMVDYTGGAVIETWQDADVKKVIIQQGITEIGEGVFSRCTNLEEVTVSSSVTEIGTDAFSGCAALTTIRYSGKQEQWNAITIASGNEALTQAKLLLTSYAITYKNIDGATNPNPDTADKDKVLTLNNATRTGYIFGGWYKEDSFTTKVTTIPADNEADVTLYAKWMPISYSVSFDANGGVGSAEKITLKYGEMAEVPGFGFSRTGYTFSGWNTQIDGRGTAYAFGQSVTNLSSTQGTNVVLYAQWTANSYQVKFDLNGGEGKLDGWKATYDKPFKLPDENSATRENYSLIGWITVIDGENVTYTPGQEVKNLASEDGTVITFIAQWGESGTFGTLTWKLTEDGTLTISGSGEMDSLGYPWEDYASTVRRLEVQSGVTSIAKSAFSGFEALEEVVLADTVTIIDGSAFSMCGKLSKLDLGSGLRVIYSHAFEFCDSLEEVNFPASASSISPSAFENCGSLQNFHVASGNENYCDAEGVLFWNGKILLAAFPGGRTGSYMVPGSVKTIGDCAFYASKLTEVVLPSGLKTMGDYCFRYSTVSQLTLPAGLENLGVGAFEACRKLKNVIVPSSVKTVPESAFSLSGLETVTLEDGITAIEKEAFLSCAITKITVPSSVTSIGEHALGYEANRMNYDKIAGFTIVGLEGSAAQEYADSNGFQFEKIPMAIQLDIPDTITAGASIQLKAQVVPARYDTGRYIWSLKNEADSAYVTLSGNKLTAKPVPEVLHVTVVCTNGNLQAERPITIVPSLAGITVYHEEEPVSGSLSVDLNETDTVILTAGSMPESAAMEPKWTWSDTKGAFGTYSQEDGALTVKLNRYAKLGTVTLTVTDQLTKKKAAVKLSTTRKSFGDIIILGASSTMTGGSSLKLEALFSGSPANTKVLWSLDDEDQAYASITSAGKLTAAQVTEEHTITVHAQAADGGSSGTSQITLVPKVQALGLLLDGEAVEKSVTIYLNDTRDLCLAANTWPEDAFENVTWTVSKNKIATAQTRSDGTLYLSQFTGETGTITVKATAQDGSKKTVSLQLKFARRPDSVNILDSKGKKIEEPVPLKGKQSYSFKTEIRTQHGEKLTDKDLVWYVDSDDEGYVTLKNGKVSVRSFASNEPVTVFIEARVKSHPETKDRIELKLLPDQGSGIYIDDVYNRKRLNDTTYTIDRSKVLFYLRARTVGLPDDTVVWSLAKPTDVVTIEEDGTVWLKKAGTVTITAINPASKKKASFKLVVTNHVRKLTISDAPIVLSGGKKATLKAQTIPDNPTNGKLTWFLLDNSGGAASITPAGVLTASKVTGVHTVKVAVMTQNAMDVSDPVEIRIIPAASRVAISGMPHNNTVDLNTCSSLKLTARVYPGVSSQKVNWSSSNKSVLVDENGNVTILSGVKPGSVTLTATAADGSGKKTTVKLSLVHCATSISMVNSAAVTGGKSLKLSATVDKPATNKKLVWSMTGDTAYCTLSGGTLKTKAVTTVKHVTVRATAADGSGVYAECDVTILPK